MCSTCRMSSKPWKRNVRPKLLCIMNIRRKSRWEIKFVLLLFICFSFRTRKLYHCTVFSYFLSLFFSETKTEGWGGQCRWAEVCEWSVGKLWLLIQSFFASRNKIQHSCTEDVVVISLMPIKHTYSNNPLRLTLVPIIITTKSSTTVVADIKV